MTPTAPQSFIFKGKTDTFKLLSGKLVTLRESNGEDESKLSNVKDALDGTNLLNFLSGVIIAVDGVDTVVSPKELGEWHRNDIYYALLCQRILTHGADMEMSAFCNNPECKCSAKKTKHPFVVDIPLNEYLMDAKDENNETLATAAPAYPLGLKQETDAMILPKTGIQVKFRIESFNEYMNNVKNTGNNLNKNTVILDHKTELFIQDRFQPLTVLTALSASQAGEVRKEINKLDPIFYPSAEYECLECGTPHEERLMNIPSFFYPEEQL